MFRQSVSFSSEWEQSNCKPRQTPKKGCFRSLINRSSFRAFKYFIAVLASPCPGNITLSAFWISSKSSVKAASTPSLSKAYKTESTFPELYLITATFIKEGRRFFGGQKSYGSALPIKRFVQNSAFAGRRNRLFQEPGGLHN